MCRAGRVLRLGLSKADDLIGIVFQIADGELPGDLDDAIAAVEAAFVDAGIDRMTIRGRMVALNKIIGR